MLPVVTMTSLPSGKFKVTILLDRNVNSSCLLHESHKKSAHFHGSLVLPATFLQIPLLRLSLVDSLILLGM